jgi:hypothetical protein
VKQQGSVVEGGRETGASFSSFFPLFFSLFFSSLVSAAIQAQVPLAPRSLLLLLALCFRPTGANGLVLFSFLFFFFFFVIFFFCLVFRYSSRRIS